MSEYRMMLPPGFSQRHAIDRNGARHLVARASEAHLETEDGVWYALANDGSRHQIRERGGTPPDAVSLVTREAPLDHERAAFEPGAVQRAGPCTARWTRRMERCESC